MKTMYDDEHPACQWAYGITESLGIMAKNLPEPLHRQWVDRALCEINALRKVLNARVHTPGGWRSFRECKPPPNTPVLVWGPGFRSPVTAKFVRILQYGVPLWFTTDGKALPGWIRYWMPLPMPPALRAMESHPEAVNDAIYQRPDDA